MTAHDVLNFWFQELSPQQWFRGGDTVDTLIRDRFESIIDPVFRGEKDDWADTPEGRLALILILDQFPRNLYRSQPKSFSYDEKALVLTLEGLDLKVDEKLSPHQRAFFYLPLEHCEEMAAQDRSIERYAALVTQLPESEREGVRHYLEYAWNHYVIIKRFGRYPHRNDILGRESTAKEVAFLKEPGSSFL